MKKIMMLMLAVFALAFVSCDEDSPMPIGNDGVTGNWVPKSAAVPGLIDEGKMISYVVFDANGAYTEHLVDVEGEESTRTAAYAVYDNGYIVLTLDGDMYRKVKYDVNANKSKLTLEGLEFNNVVFD